MLFLLKTVFYSQKSTNPSSPGDTRLPVDWDIVLYIPSMLIFPGICHFKMNKNPLYFSLTCIRQKAKGFPRMRIFSTTTVIPSPAGGWCGMTITLFHHLGFPTRRPLLIAYTSSITIWKDAFLFSIFARCSILPLLKSINSCGSGTLAEFR